MNTSHASRSTTVLEGVVARHVRAARAVDVDVDRRVIDAVIVPYGEAARVTDDGHTFYEETFEAGGATPADRVYAYSGHRPTARGIEHGEAIGIARNLTETAEGLRGEIHVAPTLEGDRVLALARTFGEVFVSAEYALPRAYGAGETVVRSASADGVIVDGVAVVLPPARPQFAGAIAAARSDGGDEEEGDEGEGDEGEGDEGDAQAQAARAAIPELVRREVARYAGRAAQAGRRRGPLDAYSSMRELADAARSLPSAQAAELSQAFRVAYVEWTARRQAARALVDQVPADNPGVFPPSWLTTVFGIIDRGRPAITALGGARNAGDTGLELDWPYFDGDLRALVGVQAAPKTEVTTVKVSLKKGSANLATYAGASDIAYQLIRRSSPSYLATYQRIMSLAYAVVTEDAFEDALEAIATPTGAVYDPIGADADGALLRAWAVSASIAVESATGTPATVILASTDSFAAIAGRPWLQAPQYGTVNAAGTSSAATLRVDVSGLPVMHAPALSAQTLVATNAEAAGWYEDGPQLVQADNIAELGLDVAIWGLGATGVHVPAGVVKNDPTVVASRSSK